MAVEYCAPLCATNTDAPMPVTNTTAASAITAILTGQSVVDVTGRGTGIGNDALTKKMQTAIPYTASKSIK